MKLDWSMRFIVLSTCLVGPSFLVDGLSRGVTEIPDEDRLSKSTSGGGGFPSRCFSSFEQSFDSWLNEGLMTLFLV